MAETVLEKESNVSVRRLRPDDLGRVVALDHKIVGRDRSQFYEAVLQRNLNDTGVQVSLAAELDGMFVGFLLARAWYGEFGTMEPHGVLEAFGVHPDFRKQGIGHALLEQLVTNLRGLRISTLRTEVDWRDIDLIRFFHSQEFEPAKRLVLERTL